MTWLFCPYCRSPRIYRIAISQPTMDHILRDKVHPQTKMTRINADYFYRADPPIPAVTVGYCGECSRIWSPIDLSNISDICESGSCGTGGSGTPGPQGPAGPEGPQGPQGEPGADDFYVTFSSSAPTDTPPLYTHFDGDGKTHIHFQLIPGSAWSFAWWVGISKGGTLGTNGWIKYNNYTL